VSARTVLYALLLVVAGAAAVLSFAALRDLALICGFAPWLAWLLPVVVDAGAAAGSLVWLGGWSAESARRFARSLALALLALSVAANALGHGLAAFNMAPAWWVVVVVSAVAPAVLGAVVHLAVLVGRADHAADPAVPGRASRIDLDEPVPYALTVAAFDAERLDNNGLSRFWDHAGPAPAPRGQRAAELIADGAGRRRLARELGISEYEARQLIDRTRSTPDTTGPADADPDVAVTSTSTEHDAAPQWASAVNGSGGPSS
jgi:hypothetical protein